MAKKGKVIRIHKDRISELPADILDNIMGLLPIEEAARTAVLSRALRDTWFNLTRLNFDDDFNNYMDKKYSDDCTTAGFHVIHQVLLQHKGSINKFVFSIQGDPITILPRAFDFDQWLLRVTRKGVEEFHLRTNQDYSLPDYIFSCPTLKKLCLYGVSFEPVDAPSILPNVTSLCFQHVDFINIIAHSAVVPMLEDLSFNQCRNLPDFNITAPKLSNLRINSSHSVCRMLPASLDLRSVCTLDLDYSSLKDFIEEINNTSEIQPPALNVEYLKLSNGIYSVYDMSPPVFVDLLQLCPKLCRLDLRLGSFSKFVKVVSTSALEEELLRVVQTHKKLRTLKISSLSFSRSEMHFIKLLLACFTGLEKVIIVCHRKFSNDTKIMKKLLRFPCASSKVKYFYNGEYYDNID